MKDFQDEIIEIIKDSKAIAIKSLSIKLNTRISLIMLITLSKSLSKINKRSLRSIKASSSLTLTIIIKKKINIMRRSMLTSLIFILLIVTAMHLLI